MELNGIYNSVFTTGSVLKYHLSKTAAICEANYYAKRMLQHVHFEPKSWLWPLLSDSVFKFHVSSFLYDQRLSFLTFCTLQQAHFVDGTS